MPRALVPAITVTPDRPVDKGVPYRGDCWLGQRRALPLDRAIRLERGNLIFCQTQHL